MAGTVDGERQRRRSLWNSIYLAADGGVEPSHLRELGIYGGAQGVWVDKARTGPLTPTGTGMTVGILHTGRHYPDELSEDGLIYHYPQTGRPAGRDQTEVEATKSAGELDLPIFVILPGRTFSRRTVRLGWVTDWDDATKQFLILFGDHKPDYDPPPLPEAPFTLVDDEPQKRALTKVRGRQQQFRFKVLSQYGAKCAVCSITHPQLLVAAHIRDKRHKGSDDWRNGLPLCATHHAAFDCRLFEIEPETLRIVVADGIAAESLAISGPVLAPLKNRPHPDALAWRCQRKPAALLPPQANSDKG